MPCDPTQSNCPKVDPTVDPSLPVVVADPPTYRVKHDAGQSVILFSGVAYTVAAALNSVIMQKRAEKMSLAAQKATQRAFIYEITAAMVTLIMSGAGIILGGTVMSWVNLGVVLVSLAGVLSRLIL